MDKRVFYHYIDRFGFGKLTGIDLPGETTGVIKPIDSVKPIDVATMTFGQGLTVTPIQQIQAINALANGGKLMKPYVIDEIYDPNRHEVVVDNKPKVIDPEVVSPQTAQKMKELLESVVNEGTGVNFYLDGYQVAGKTGTAQKPKQGGGYYEDKYIHSFLGFAPKDEPKLSMFVAVDAPQVEQYHLGGAAVAQVFKPVMEKSLHYLNVSQEAETVVVNETVEEKVKMGDYIGMTVSQAATQAESEGFNVHLEGQGNVVTRQVPLPGEALLPGSRIYLIAGDLRYVEMPDLSGWPLKDVQEWAGVVGLELVTTGHGYVTEQDVAKGELIRPGTTINVHLEPLTAH
jgi:penicillin-binding protein 2B